MSELNTRFPKIRGGPAFLSYAPYGRDSNLIIQRAARVSNISSPATQLSNTVKPNATIADKLYDSRAAFKIRTAAVAMHLNKEWRDRLFAQVDNLLDADEWDESDTPVLEASFATFLRMILLLKANRRPGLGSTSEGNIVAAWSEGQNRLTIECLPTDQIRWVLVRYPDNGRESAAGQTDLLRLLEVLAPYDPKRWFLNEEGGRSFRLTTMSFGMCHGTNFERTRMITS